MEALEMTTTVEVNGERLWGALMDLAKIGATPKGGNCRLALTAEDGKGRDLAHSQSAAICKTKRTGSMGSGPGQSLDRSHPEQSAGHVHRQKQRDHGR